jgi:copper chaperone
MSDHQYKFNVTMTCGGCSGAVERVLKKLEGKHRVVSSLFDANMLTRWSLGVKTFDVSLETQTVNVTTEPTLSYDDVLEKIKKTGKAVNSGEADGESKEV